MHLCFHPCQYLKLPCAWATCAHCCRASASLVCKQYTRSFISAKALLAPCASQCHNKIPKWLTFCAPDFAWRDFNQLIFRHVTCRRSVHQQAEVAPCLIMQKWRVQQASMWQNLRKCKHMCWGVRRCGTYRIFQCEDTWWREADFFLWARISYIGQFLLTHWVHLHSRKPVQQMWSCCYSHCRLSWTADACCCSWWPVYTRRLRMLTFLCNRIIRHLL